MQALGSQFIPEVNHTFLNIWSHRYDFIHAPHPLPNEKPNWKTERRFPLSDRQILQGQELFGVRFTSETNYIMLDIDIGSPYHPHQDPLAIQRLLTSLEDLELSRYLACTSSHSGGLHLYFPFEIPLKSWKIALATSIQLENAGFHPKPGWLEIFPNPRPYETDGTPRLYNGHRLPLQNGSYLLNPDWEPISLHPSSFVHCWKTVQSHNLITPQVVNDFLKVNNPKQYKVSKSANKFLNDLNTEIEPGWTDSGQTNYLIGRIAMRTYIFGHILQRRSTPLEGQDLVNEMLRVVQNLPGFREFCNHVDNIKTRVQEWARAVENSKYYPYRFKNRSETKQLKLEEIEDDKPNWHQEKKEEARAKIQGAIADLLNHNCLPSATRKRFDVLTKEYHIGGKTLYKNRDLWHPEHIRPVENAKSIEAPFQKCPGGTFRKKSPNLLDPSLVTSHEIYVSELQNQEGLEHSNNNGETESCKTSITPEQVRIQIQLACKRLKASLHKAQKEHQARIQAQQAKRTNRWQQEYEMKMESYWTSGEPILMAEARTWAQKQSLIPPDT
jgi:hypothetical protein